MLKINSIINDVLGGVPEVFPLNILKPLDFLLEQECHDAEFQEILDLTHSEVSLVEFKQLVKAEVERLKSLRDKNPKVESLVALGGKNLFPFKFAHRVWGSITLYFTNGFAYKSYEEIADVYESRIGSIVLDGIKSITLMKQSEATTGVEAHDYKFYEDTEKTRSRAIEFLVAGSKQDSEYFNNLYLTNGIDDLFQNFLHVLYTQPLEAECLSVVETKENGMLMQYRNQREDIVFQTITFRLLRTLNSLGQFGIGMRKVAQLENLDVPNHHSRYPTSITIKVGSSTSTPKRKLAPIHEELEADLFKQFNPLPDVCTEEQLELKSKTNRIRRDDGRGFNETANEKVASGNILSPYMQSRRNRAVSSKIAKNGLHLPSDYNIATIEILSEFMTSLPIDSKEDKLYASLIMITLVLGCQFEDTMCMLLEDKASIFTYDDGIITVKIEKSLFASKVSTDFLQKSNEKISFNVPHLLSLSLADTKRTLSSMLDTEEVDVDELKKQVDEYIKHGKKLFPKKISIATDKLHRQLKSYVKATDADLVTSFFATATYHQNDTPKMSYTATNRDSQAHSQLIHSHWLELGLDSLARNLLGLGGEIFATKPIILKEPKYAGSSRCANAVKTKEFNSVMDENIKLVTVAEDDDTLFALASIKIGYAMSFLAGTRNFNNSADFTSWSYHLGTTSISEKATTVSSGIKVPALCDVINNGLKSYNEIFLKPRALPQRVCFLDAEKVVPFTQRSALKALKKIPNLMKRAVLEEYVQNVPLNTGRHCFAKKATELSISSEYISAYLGHSFSGSEQFGIYSTLNTKKYYEQVRYVTSTIAIEFGIGGLSW